MGNLIEMYLLPLILYFITIAAVIFTMTWIKVSVDSRLSEIATIGPVKPLRQSLRLYPTTTRKKERKKRLIDKG